MTSGTGVARNRRLLQLALGLVWLIDAALQYQPYMFSTRFVVQVLEPAAQGNPWIIARPMLWADHFMVHDIGLWNALYATIQLALAIGLFWKPTVKWALAGSVVWSVGVWWFGEGLGGVFSDASPVVGAPGGVILYALLAVLVWPRSADGDDLSVARSGPLGRLAPEVLWAVLWGSFAYFFLVPTNRGPQGLHDTVAGAATGEPGWIRSIDSGLATALNQHGTEFSIVLAILCIIIALGIFFPLLLRPVVGLVLLVSLAIWVTEDFGTVFAGNATDVNSGPLLALLAWAYWPVVRAVRAPAVAPPGQPVLS